MNVVKFNNNNYLNNKKEIEVFRKFIPTIF